MASEFVKARLLTAGPAGPTRDHRMLPLLVRLSKARRAGGGEGEGVAVLFAGVGDHAGDRIALHTTQRRKQSWRRVRGQDDRRAVERYIELVLGKRKEDRVRVQQEAGFEGLEKELPRRRAALGGAQAGAAEPTQSLPGVEELGQAHRALRGANTARGRTRGPRRKYSAARRSAIAPAEQAWLHACDRTVWIT